ncbi:MAG: hypothetical protein JWN03_8467 [Nocardia sp.]|nr:hypothetical protein [Nocardia sp.]
MGWFKDLAVGVVTVAGTVGLNLAFPELQIPLRLAAPLIGAAVGGVTTLIQTGSPGEAFKAAAMVGAGVFGGMTVGGMMGREAIGQGIFGGIGGMIADHFAPSSRSGSSPTGTAPGKTQTPPPIPASLPTRPAGVQYRNVDSTSVIPLDSTGNHLGTGTVSA